MLFFLFCSRTRNYIILFCSLVILVFHSVLCCSVLFCFVLFEGRKLHYCTLFCHIILVLHSVLCWSFLFCCILFCSLFCLSPCSSPCSVLSIPFCFVLLTYLLHIVSPSLFPNLLLLAICSMFCTQISILLCHMFSSVLVALSRFIILSSSRDCFLTFHCLYIHFHAILYIPIYYFIFLPHLFVFFALPFKVTCSE